MRKMTNFFKDNLAVFIVLFVAVLSLGFALAGKKAEDGSITLDGSKAVIEQATEEFIKESKIVYAKEAKKALIQLDGSTEELDVPTVENIDSSKATKDENSEVGGRGWSVDASSPSAFRNAVIGKCIDTDGAYGSQCWDLGNLFWRNYTGRSFNTCGTGAAKGTIQNGCWQKNAGSEFEMIWDKTKIQAGDWVVFNNDTWGHVGMALGGYNNGYVALLGANQGGVACAGGGSSANIINMGLSSFAGAFRPKKYATVATSTAKTTNNSTPTQNATTARPAQSVNTYTVRAGDTLGDIAIKNGWWSGGALFGDNGYTQALAEKNGILNRGVIYPGQVINK